MTKRRFSDKEYEVLRRRTVELWDEKSWTQEKISEALGVDQGSVSRWLRKFRQGGLAAIKNQPKPGAKPRLDRDRHPELSRMLKQGALAHGFQTNAWTRGRVCQLLQKEFGVKLSERQAGRLLQQIGYTVQRPKVQDARKDPEALEKWKEERLPAIKKS